MRKKIVKAFNSCKILICIVIAPIITLLIFYVVLKMISEAADYEEIKEDAIEESVVVPGIKYVLEDKERLADFPIDGYVEESIPETAQEDRGDGAV